MENALDPREIRRRAYVRIVEQPAAKTFRFRYESEGRFTGSLPGVNSSPSSKTFPSIQVVGYVGKCYVVVSCVTKDYPHRPHPHLLAGRDCRRGICRLDIPPETMTLTFTNLGIRCVKRKEVEENLRLRQRMNIDPFRTGFDPNKPTPIDLNVVRLCFQVIVQTPTKDVMLDPVVSEPIYNKKVQSDLNIVKLSDCTSYVDGRRKEMILLCEKVDKEDIEVRFYEEVNGQIVWEALADIQYVHKQFAITFIAPPYYRTDVLEPVKAQIQLRRPSDGGTSDSRPFELLPVILEIDSNRKRKCINTLDCDRILDLQQQLNFNKESYDASNDASIPSVIQKHNTSPYEDPFSMQTSQLDQAAAYPMPPQTSTNPFTLERQLSEPTSLKMSATNPFNIERKFSDPTHVKMTTNQWIILPESSMLLQNDSYFEQNVPKINWSISPTNEDVNNQPMWNVNAIASPKSNNNQKLDTFITPDDKNNLNPQTEYGLNNQDFNNEFGDNIDNLSGNFSGLSFMDNSEQIGTNTDDSLSRFVNNTADMLCFS